MTTIDVPPCGDPEHLQYNPPGTVRRGDLDRRVKGAKVGLPGLELCPPCYNRRYWRLKKAGMPRKRDLPRPPEPGTHYAYPRPACRTPVSEGAVLPASVPGDLGLMAPAEFSRFVRRIWDRPEAGVILTSPAWAGVIDDEEA